METDQVLGVDRSIAFTDTELNILYNVYSVRVIAFYLGGPYYSVDGWTKEDIDRAMNKGFHVVPIYVGQNVVPGSVLPKLTIEQGLIDAHEAISLMVKFGFGDLKHGPVLLDVEQTTAEYDLAGTLDYVESFTRSLRDDYINDGVYSSLDFISKMTEHEISPSWVCVAKWDSKTFDGKLKLDNINGLPNSVFTHNSRAWQYAGNVQVNGINSPVDIDLFDYENVIMSDNAKSIIDTSTKIPIDEKELYVKSALEHIENSRTLLERAIILLKG